MLTGVVLARNEERNITACLAALRPHVAELILIDMESTDRTVELARPYIDKLLSHPVTANFDAVRNIAIPSASHDWLWFVDADERVSLKTGRLVGELIRRNGHEFEAITIPFKTYFCGKWMQHCGWWPGYTMPRVLKRGHFQFANRLHGGVELDGRGIHVAPEPELAIDHWSYESVEHYLDKFNRYTTSEAKQLLASGAPFDWRAGLRDMMRDLWGYYELNHGDRDGAHGWILSWLSGQYRWVAQAKLLDLLDVGNESVQAPSSLDEVMAALQDELAQCRATRPQLPLGIVWRAPLWDPSGYADESRQFVKALATGERPLAIDELRWSDRTCSLPDEDTALLRALMRARHPSFSAAITNCIPSLCRPDPRSSLNILRTTFETDRIPAFWLPFIEHFDEVWVLAEHNRIAFQRSGVAPEKIRVVPSCVDTACFHPEGDRIDLPAALSQRFVFLSVFDWQLRKGWDVLVRAFCQEFTADDRVGLLLKITTAHGHTARAVRDQLETLLSTMGESLERRPEIVVCDETFNTSQLAALYRSTDAFVLASRGEGWGRTYMEAMATGMATIGTRGSGNADFMDERNSFLVSTDTVSVSNEAALEIPVYRGHRWQEPQLTELRHVLRQVYSDPHERKLRGQQARLDMTTSFSLAKGRESIEQYLAAAEARFQPIPVPDIGADQIRVELEGEFFAAHSFANINERLAQEFIQDKSLAVSLRRVQHQPVFPPTSLESRQLLAYMQRPFEAGPHITIRHAFPPNFSPPAEGLWVHIQPWEFGHLPKDWIPPLRDRVDEIWAPSNYVRHVFERSRIPADKIHVIPWGIDPSTFRPDAPPLILPTSKTFAFLFVGGTIARKGFDILFEAFQAEFHPDEDVCLVVKDIGTNSFYKSANHRDQLVAAANDPSSPQIIYLDSLLTPGQLASLYAACQCFVAPYRGEGFGLPILEAMACGLPVIVPRGGPSDDFVSPETAWLLDSQEVACEHPWPLCGTPYQLEVQVEQLRKLMRQSFEQRERTQLMGQAASASVRQQFTWSRTAERMSERLHALRARGAASRITSQPSIAPVEKRISVGACLVTENNESQIADCLARVAPFVDELIILDRDSTDRTRAIAVEYGARVVALFSGEALDSTWQRLDEESRADWVLLLDVHKPLSERLAQSLHSLAAEQPQDVRELTLPCDSDKGGEVDNAPNVRMVRRTRLAASHCTT